MTYVDGFVLAVPTANRDAYQQLVKDMATIFLEYGALKVVEYRDDNVPEGKGAFCLFQSSVQRLTTVHSQLG